MKTISNLLLYFTAFSIVACVKSPIEHSVLEVEHVESKLLTKSTYSYSSMRNPYSLRNMQAASDSLNASLNLPIQELHPTDLYLCFTPQDTLEYKQLEDQGYELFAYPLDDNYVPDYLPSDTLCTLYCVVPFDDVIPAIAHSVIDTCYIPLIDVPELVGRMYGEEENYSVQLERLAYELSGNSLDCQSENTTRSLFNRYGPSGIMRLDNVPDNSETNAPLKRMKVVANSFVRYRTQYTDESGAFDFPNVFINPPKIRVKSESPEDCKVYDTNHYIGFAPTEYILPGTYTDAASYSFDPTPFYCSALVFKYYNDYIDICERESIPLPPLDMNFSIVTSRPYGGGAPMLKHFYYSDYPQLFDSVLESIVDALVSIVSQSTLYTLFRGLCPDVIINCSSLQDVKLYTFHELTHASHFAAGGSMYWGAYISEIVTSWLNSSGNEVYGNGYGRDLGQQFLELSESMAYCMSDIRLGQPSYNDEWFNISYYTISGLLDDEILSMSELFSVINSDVTCMDDLCSALCLSFPERAWEIMSTFLVNSSLNSETHWVIKNCTSGDLDVNLVWENKSSHVVLHQNEETSFADGPGGITINRLRTDFSKLYPKIVEIKKDNVLIFAQYDRQLPSVRLPKAFIYDPEWVSSMTINDFRGKAEITCRFDIEL